MKYKTTFFLILVFLSSNILVSADNSKSSVKFYKNSHSYSHSHNHDEDNENNTDYKYKKEKSSTSYFDETRAKSAFEWGNIHFKQGNFERALERYNEALKYDPNFKQARKGQRLAKANLEFISEMGLF